jgi:hypothetical protein
LSCLLLLLSCLVLLLSCLVFLLSCLVLHPGLCTSVLFNFAVVSLMLALVVIRPEPTWERLQQNWRQKTWIERHPNPNHNPIPNPNPYPYPYPWTTTSSRCCPPLSP